MAPLEKENKQKE